MQYESEALREEYKNLRSMSQEKKDNIISRVQRYYRKKDEADVGDGYGYSYAFTGQPPSDEDLKIYELLTNPPEIRDAQPHPDSRAAGVYDANRGWYGARTAPMTSTARRRIMEFAGEDYMNVADDEPRLPVMPKNKPIKLGSKKQRWCPPEGCSISGGKKKSRKKRQLRKKSNRRK
jgi:hypothetical protein